MSKRVVHNIPLSILRDAHLKLEEVINMLDPYLVALNPPERQGLARMGAESFEFIEVSYGLAVGNPELLPAFVDASIFGEDFSIAQELWSFTAKLDQLKDIINDAEMAAGNYGLEAALAFYNMIKIAARHDIPGARMIFEELKSRRPSGRRLHPPAACSKAQTE